MKKIGFKEKSEKVTEEEVAEEEEEVAEEVAEVEEEVAEVAVAEEAEVEVN